MLVLDEDRRYREIMTTQEELLVYPVKLLLEGRMHDVFPEDVTDFFLDGVRGDGSVPSQR